MIKEDSDLLQSVDGPYHPNIERTRQQYFAKKKSEDERQLAEKARVYYQDKWVLGKEKKLQKQEDASTDPKTTTGARFLSDLSQVVDVLARGSLVISLKTVTKKRRTCSSPQ